MGDDGEFGIPQPEDCADTTRATYHMVVDCEHIDRPQNIQCLPCLLSDPELLALQGCE